MLMDARNALPYTKQPEGLTREETARRAAVAAAWADACKTQASPLSGSDEGLTIAACLSMLAASGLNSLKTRHSVLVGLGALRIGHALAQGGFLWVSNTEHMSDKHELAFNPHLFLYSGLLHDLLRYENEHAVHGGGLLTSFGLVKTGYAVACHTRLPVDMLVKLGVTFRDGGFLTAELPCGLARQDAAEARGAALCVYAADKYAFGDLLVPLYIRFKLIHDYFFNPPKSLDKRKLVAESVEKIIHTACGRKPLDVVASPCADSVTETDIALPRLAAECAALEQELFRSLPHALIPRLYDKAELDKALALPPQRFHKKMSPPKTDAN